MPVNPVTFAKATLLTLLASSAQMLGATAIAPASLSPFTNAAGAGNSSDPVFSKSGRYVLFVSEARNLVTNGNRGRFLDVFRRDLASEETVLVSVACSGTGGGNGNSTFPAVCTNEHIVAFESLADNLAAGDTNGFSDIFVRDLANLSTTVASVGQNGNANGPSLAPLLSSGGHRVAFESMASNLVSNDLNAANDIFLRDLDLEVTVLVSVAADGLSSANGSSFSASISSDANRIAFVSTANNLIEGVTNRSGEIYFRDLVVGRTGWVSTNVLRLMTNWPGAFRCMHPVMSANGQFVAFKAVTTTNASRATPVPVAVFRHDLQNGITSLISTNSSDMAPPEISSDGRFVAYDDGPHVMVWDGASGTNRLVNLAMNGSEAANGIATTPVMTPDGRRVAYLSSATDLVTNQVNGTFQIYLRDLAVQTSELVSISTNGLGLVRDDLAPTLPALSDDGLMVAFRTEDSSLVPNDWNQAADVFIRDVQSATTKLASARHPLAASTTGAALTFLEPGAISSNGQFVAFASLDNNLTPDDTNDVQDVFFRDFVSGRTKAVSAVSAGDLWFGTNALARRPRISGSGGTVTFVQDWLATSSRPNASDVYLYTLTTGGTTLISRDDTHGPGSLPTFNSDNPAINFDGSMVAFESRAAAVGSFTTNLNGHSAIFLWRSNQIELVSFTAQGANNGNNDSLAPTLTPNGRWVLFLSAATDLTADSLAQGYFRLFARDLLNGQTRLLSFNQIGLPINESISHVAVDADSSRVAFDTTNSHLIYVCDLRSSSSTNQLICSGCANPSINGSVLAYETRNGTSAVNDVFTRDLITGDVLLASVNRSGNGGGNGSSSSPQVSSDGRFLIFASHASDLVENDSNMVSDIFVRDRLLGTTYLVSFSFLSGGPPNGVSGRPILAGDGRTVAFESFASDLVAADFNTTRNIYVARLLATDSDHDGMDDEWEIAYFNTLERNGTSDYDHDGRSDREEFLAGTDPTDSGSVFRVLAIRSLTAGTVAITWHSVIGRTYAIQYKESANGATWSNLGQNIRATGSTTSTQDTSGNIQRFYRATLVR